MKMKVNQSWNGITAFAVHNFIVRSLFAWKYGGKLAIFDYNLSFAKFLIFRIDFYIFDYHRFLLLSTPAAYAHKMLLTDNYRDLFQLLLISQYLPSFSLSPSRKNRMKQFEKI